MKSELQLNQGGGLLVLTEIDDDKFTLTGNVKNITAVGPNGVVPSDREDKRCVVHTKYKDSTFEGKLISSTKHSVILEIEGTQTAFTDHLLVTIPNDNTWKLDSHEGVTVHAQISSIRWAPKYVLIVGTDQKLNNLPFVRSLTTTERY
jgi:hypothetical protein